MPDGPELTSTPPVADARRKGPYRTIGTDRVKWGATAVTIALPVLAIVSGKVLVFWIIFALAWLLMTWRAWILGVYVEQNGVRIVQYVTTKRVAWEDIDHFAVLPAGNYPFAGQIVIRGRSRPLVIAAMGAAARPNPEGKRLQVQRPIDELNAILAERREQAGRWPIAAAGDSSQASGSSTAADLSLSFRTIRVQILITASIGVTVAASLAIANTVSPALGAVIGCVCAAYALALVG